MGKRTSVYLSAEMAAAVDRTGLPLAELIRRGIFGPPANPVVVPLRPGEATGMSRDRVEQIMNDYYGNQSRDDAVVVPADAPAKVAAPAGVPQPAEVPQRSWTCSSCSWRMAQPGVTHCESCGWPRDREVQQ